MDYSKLSTEQLEELAASGGDLSKISTGTLEALSAEPEKSGWDTAKDVGGAALDYGLRGLDYIGGLGRTAAYGAYDELAQAGGWQEGDKINSQEDLMAALKGQAPDSAQQLERLGLDKMGTVDLPFLGEVSTRGAVGLASDIALDPLTYFTLGASGVAKAGKGVSKLQKLARPLAKAESSVGKKLFRSGLKKVDEAVGKLSTKGKNEFSDVLLKNKIRGSANDLVGKVDDLANSLKGAKDEIIQEATDLGATIDAKNVLGEFRKEVGELATGKNVKTVKSQAKGMLDEIDDILAFGSKTDDAVTKTVKQTGILDAAGKPITRVEKGLIKGTNPLTVAEADSIKTQLYNVMRSDAYSELAKTPAGTKIQKKVAGLFKDSIENSVQQTTGKGTLLKSTNKDLGTLLSGKKQLVKEASKETTKNSITAVDAMLAGAGMSGAGPAPLILKKAADISKGANFRTTVGKGLYNDPGVADALLRRGNTLLNDRSER